MANLKKRLVYLETNGILYENFKKIKRFIDIVAIDIKLPSSAKAGVFWAEHEEFLKGCYGNDIFVKIIITLSTEICELKKALDLVKRFDRDITVVLQPNYFELGPKLIKKMRSGNLYKIQ